MAAPAGGAGPARRSAGPAACSTPARRRPPWWPRLEQDADQYTWVAATIGANEAAGYQLATDRPVMAIGGFNGTDPSPTLAQFEAMVRAGQIHWFIAGGFGGFGGFGGRGSITAWVEQHYQSVTVGGPHDLRPHRPPLTPIRWHSLCAEVCTRHFRAQAVREQRASRRGGAGRGG